MKVVQKLLEAAREFRLKIISILFVTLTILILYWQDFSVLASEALQNEAMSHVILAPLFALLLVYRRRDLVGVALNMEKVGAKVKMPSLDEITGIAFCLSAFLLYWCGSYTFHPLEYHTFSFVVFLIGVTLILSNIKTLRVLIFPVLFLLFLVPPPSWVTFSAGALLGSFNSHTSYALLKATGLPVVLSTEFGSPTLIVSTLSEGYLELVVDVSCSGIYSLVAFSMFATFLVYAARGSITKKIMLFPIGFAMLTILNILRISLTAFIAYQFGEQVAMNTFHILSGWFLVFLGAFLLLLVCEKLLHVQIFPGRDQMTSNPACRHDLRDESFCLSCGKSLKESQDGPPKRFWLKATALFLCCSLVVFTLQAPVFAFAQRLAVSDSDPSAAIAVFPEFGEYKPHFLSRYRDFEQISGQDASLLYIYLSPNAFDPNIHVLVGVSGSLGRLHGWEGCLVTWQIAQGLPPLVDVLDSREVQIMQDPLIIGQYLVFKHPDNYTQVTLYWYIRALFKTGLTVEPKYTRISLIILTQNPDEYPELEHKLLSVGQIIAAYWEPLKAQSLISLGIPAMQILLAIAILTAVILQITQYTKEWRRKTTSLKIFESLASPMQKLLYKTIKDLNRRTKGATTHTIASAFGEAWGKSARPNDLIETLNSMRKLGIIRADVASIQDQPRLVWKP